MHLVLASLVVYRRKSLIFRTGNVPNIADSSGIIGMRSGDSTTAAITHVAIEVRLNLLDFPASVMGTSLHRFVRHEIRPPQLIDGHLMSIEVDTGGDDNRF
jgi:hypothetical protein